MAAPAREQAARPNVIHISGIEFPSPHARTIQVLHTCVELARLGCRVDLIAGSQRRNAVLDEELRPYGLTPHPQLVVHKVPFLRSARFRNVAWQLSYGSLAVAKAVRLARRSQGHAVIFSRDLRTTWALLKTRPLHKCPVVYEAHHLYHQVVGPARRRSVEAVERMVWSQADAVVTIVDHCRDFIAEEYPHQRVVTIRSGTREPGDPPPKHTRERGRTICYLGHLHVWKNVDSLLNILTALDARLSIVGGIDYNGPDPNRERLRERARDLGVESRVVFVGSVPYADIGSHLRKANVLVIPFSPHIQSQFFTSPLKLFDYMGSGVPIVAPAYPAIREVLTDGVNAVLVEPDDYGALERAMGRMLEDPKFGEVLARKAFEDVSDFTWGRRAEKLLSLLQELGAGK